MVIKETANAKINLYLDVFAKREDGYHDIKSIMHSVSLADTVTVDTDCNTVSLTCTDPSLPTDSKNLAFRAAEHFFAKAGIKAGAKIHIEKNIPVCGGLAGGSTDAAAVLRALNKAFGSPVSTNTLCDLGADLGADVPFCISGGCALCTGSGDKLTALPSLPETVCLIANGGEGVSTPEAYGELDRMYINNINEDKGDIDGIINAVKNSDTELAAKNAFNIFESAVLPRHSMASKLKTLMKENGAFLSMMSGSGPSVFGLFESEGIAEACAEKIHSLGAAAYICNI